MFFDFLLLNPQHKGRFGLAWVAATRGVKHINRRQLVDLDIPKLCADLQEFVMSELTTPRKRFSLRLSAILTNGTVKIYREQVIIFIDGVFRALISVRGPTIPLSGDSETFQTPPSPVIKNKKPRKRDSITKQTPPTLLEQIRDESLAEIQQGVLLQLQEPEVVVLQARVEDISLREELPKRREGFAPDELGEIGGFGDGTEMERMLRLLDEPLSIEPQTLERILPLPIEPLPRPTTRRSTSSSSGPQTPQIIKVTADVHAPADGPGIPDFPDIIIQPASTPHETAVQAKIRAVPEDEIVAAEEQEVPATQRAEIPAEEIKDRDRFRRPKATQVPRELLLNFVLPQPYYLRINRPVHGSEVIVSLRETYPEEMIMCQKLKSKNIFWAAREIDTIEFDDVRARATERRSVSMRDSSVGSHITMRAAGHTTAEVAENSTLRRAATDIKAHQSAELQDITNVIAPLLTSTPVVGKKRTYQEELPPEQVTIEEVMAPGAERPAKRHKLVLHEENEMVVDCQQIQVPHMEESASHMENTEVRMESTADPKLRHQRIIDKVLKWKGSDGDLTIDHVAEKPLNKLHVARAFGDLLLLSKTGYVTLTNAHDSLELKSIEKGPKLTKYM